MRWWLGVWLMIVVTPVTVFSAQDKEAPVVSLKELSGAVVEVDEKNSLFFIQPHEMNKNPAVNISLIVNSSTVMEKNYIPCDLSKFVLGDHADIIYSTDESGKNFALEVALSSLDHANSKREVSKKK